MRKRTGFTLIELLICLTIIGILLAVAIPAWMHHTTKQAAPPASPIKYNLETICLDGWEYYYRPDAAVLAPKWDKSAKPSACKIEQTSD